MQNATIQTNELSECSNFEQKADQAKIPHLANGEGQDAGINDRIVDEHLLNIKDVAVRLNISTRSVWRLIARNDFPKPLVIGQKTSRFVSTEIEDYIEKLKRNRTEV